MIYYAQILILVFTFVCGLHDGHSHLSNRKLTNDERKRWHRSGYIMYALFFIPLTYFIGWQVLIAGLILRGSVYDIGHNYGARLRAGYIGDGAEFWERLFLRIFGIDGGIKKAFAFMVLLIILNILNHLYAV
jgi:hypothetical protein